MCELDIKPISAFLAAILLSKGPLIVPLAGRKSLVLLCPLHLENSTDLSSKADTPFSFLRVFTSENP